jgi:type IV pilus assembly protein PilM
MPSLPKSKLNPSLSLPKLSRPSLKLSMGRRSGGPVVGLDIQPGHVVAVQAHLNGGIVADSAAALPLAADVMREGEVLDQEALAGTLRQLFADSRMDKQVRVGVANQRTVLRTLELPPVGDGKELDAAIRFQAQEQVPMPLNNAVLDFHTLGVHDTPEGPRQQVVLVAAQRDMVARLLAAVRGAGLRPAGIDLSAFALIRSFYSPGSEPGARVMYLNVDGLTNMAIAEGAVCRFTRVVGGGLEAMASQLAERLNLPVEEARSQISSANLVAAPGEGEIGEVRTVLEGGIREIAGEVRNSLDFHRAQESGGEVARVLLSGAALDIPGFLETLQTELGVSVTPETVGAAEPALGDGVSAQRLAIAAGLSVEEAQA